METLDSLTTDWAAYYDPLALLVVFCLTIKLRSRAAFLVLADFTLTYLCQNWIKSLELWGSLGLDYHYVLGIKDTLVAVALFRIAPSLWLPLAYSAAALLCWVLWASYLISEETFNITIPYLNFVIVDRVLLARDPWLEIYFAWSPLYALAMFLQMYAVTRGGGSGGVGKRARTYALSANRGGVFQPGHNCAHSNVDEFGCKTTRDY